MSEAHRLAAVTLDESSIGRGTPDQEHERDIAIYDLVEANVFSLPGRADGPYRLHVALAEARLALDIKDMQGAAIVTHILSLTPFRNVLKDYFMMCESYYNAIRNASPAQIEAIDMGRRGIHNDGSNILVERLKDKVIVDHDTARRLFTLICVLHWKG